MVSSLGGRWRLCWACTEKQGSCGPPAEHNTHVFLQGRARDACSGDAAAQLKQTQFKPFWKPAIWPSRTVIGGRQPEGGETSNGGKKHFRRRQARTAGRRDPLHSCGRRRGTCCWCRKIESRRLSCASAVRAENSSAPVLLPGGPRRAPLLSFLRQEVPLTQAEGYAGSEI